MGFKRFREAVGRALVAEPLVEGVGAQALAVAGDLDEAAAPSRRGAFRPRRRARRRCPPPRAASATTSIEMRPTGFGRWRTIIMLVVSTPTTLPFSAMTICWPALASAARRAPDVGRAHFVAQSGDQGRDRLHILRPGIAQDELRLGLRGLRRGPRPSARRGRSCRPSSSRSRPHCRAETARSLRATR